MNQEEQCVCVDCFDDPGIRDFIERNSVPRSCSFCHQQNDSSIASSLSDVAEYIKSCLYEEYDDAVSLLYWDEGEYIGDHWDTCDLLLDEIGLDLPNDVDNLLLSELAQRLDNVWCEAEPFVLDRGQVAHFSWQRFKDIVMHQLRFFFSRQGKRSESDELLAPGEMLEKIFEYAEMIGLFVRLHDGISLYRARHQESGEYLTSAQDFGPPPLAYANQSNRMSPPGIAMFYASDDPETALRETANAPATFAIGTFEARREALMLDLTLIPDVPSLFEEIPDSLEYNPRRVTNGF